MKHRTLLLAAALAAGLTLGCTSIDERQRSWIFQPGDRSWGDPVAQTQGMDEIWIDFQSKVSGSPARLHALWLAADAPALATASPVLLYLHGARWNVTASASRLRRLQDLGFSVLAIDYRGFGKSTAALPSEDTAYEDARAAWAWLAARYPTRPRYIFGHSLGGAVAIDLAAQVSDEQGTIVEGTFTSIADVAASMKWGWLPGFIDLAPLITQRFDSASKVAAIGSPLLVVHGADDSLIHSELARKLFDAAQGKKRFVLVEGGSHHSTMFVGRAAYRDAIAQLFNLGGQGAPQPQPQ